MAADPPLHGRVALVTGASRRVGIAAAVVRRLGDHGAAVLAHGFTPHDAEMSWGADPGGREAVLADLRADGRRVEAVELDLAGPDAPRRLVDIAVERLGRLDIVVAAHARSATGGLDDVDAAELDRSFAVNTRATVLLAQALAAVHDGRPGGRLVLFTSGQHLGPMPGELAYVLSKAALHGITPTLAAELATRGITVNTVNPGPTDTGYADAATHAAVERAMPSGRWGTPEDAARLVAFLCSDDAAWVTGQVIDSTGGFRG